MKKIIVNPVKLDDETKKYIQLGEIIYDETIPLEENNQEGKNQNQNKPKYVKVIADEYIVE